MEGGAETGEGVPCYPGDLTYPAGGLHTRERVTVAGVSRQVWQGGIQVIILTTILIPSPKYRHLQRGKATGGEMRIKHICELPGSH